MTRNVFVLGLDTFNRSKLEALLLEEACTFHGVLRPEEVGEPDTYQIVELMRRAEQQLESFPGSIDAIVGYIDIPVGVMLPILCAKFGVPGPTLESVLKCQHKYWSRLIQREVVPEHIPEFTVFDPFDKNALQQIPLPYPFWIKPIKSGGSHLGFHISNRSDYQQALTIILQEISRLAKPYNYLMEYLDMPPEVSWIDAHYFVAESILTGRQCTLEGYVLDDAVHVYGVVDSIRHGNRTTFFRYEYPSAIPRRVQQRMIDIAARVLNRIGLNDSPFNMEFYWRPGDDTVWLLEINTRVSQSHTPLFEKVDGAGNHQVMVEVGLGRQPTMPRDKGPYRYAAKFYLRSFVDGIVGRVPDEKEIAKLCAEVPGTEVVPVVSPGVRLSSIPEQDSYSYALAYLFLGSNNRRDLLQQYRYCQEQLDFKLTPVSTPVVSRPGEIVQPVQMT